MNEPLVSVLMPVYNGEPFLKEAIKSIINQTYSNLELIICDDNSTDATEDIIKDFSDSRIRYYKNRKRLGLVGNRNEVLSRARGKYIAIMDADDIASVNRLKIQVNFLENNEDYVICGSWAIVVNQENKQLTSWRFPTSASALAVRFYIQFPIVHSSALIRMSAIKKLKLKYDHTFEYIEDYDFCFKLILIGKVKVIDSYLIQYRIHATNTSNIYKDPVVTTLHKLYKREYSRIGLSFSDLKIEELIYLYHPYLNIKISSYLTLLDAGRLFIKLRSHYAIGILDSVKWWIYTCKSALLHIIR